MYRVCTTFSIRFRSGAKYLLGNANFDLAVIAFLTGPVFAFHMLARALPLDPKALGKFVVG